MELPTREASVKDVFFDLGTLSFVGCLSLMGGFDSILDRKKEDGANEVAVTHYLSILVAGYLSLIHPIVPVLASTVIAVFVSLFLYFRGVYGSDILTNAFLVCLPILISILLLLVDWPLYRVTLVTALSLWPNDLALMPVEIDGCRVALVATLVQGIAAFGGQGL